MSSRLERAADAILTEFCRKHDIDLAWQPQFKFDSQRKWRSDFLVYHELDSAWEHPGNGVIIEIEGITRYGNHLGRHQSANGFEADAEKYNRAQILGWKVLRYTEGMLANGFLDRDLKEFFCVTS